MASSSSFCYFTNEITVLFHELCCFDLKYQNLWKILGNGNFKRLVLALAKSHCLLYVSFIESQCFSCLPSTGVSLRPFFVSHHFHELVLIHVLCVLSSLDLLYALLLGIFTWISHCHFKLTQLKLEIF